MTKKLRERRELLHSHFTPVEGEFMFAKSMISTDTEDIAVFLDESIKGRIIEGLFIGPVIFWDFSWFQDFCKSPFASKCSWKKWGGHRGKKEVACIVSNKPLVLSCLWGCGESVNPPKIQEVQGALSYRPKGDPVSLFSGFWHPCFIRQELIMEDLVPT